jgi:hypothetical protein
MANEQYEGHSFRRWLNMEDDEEMPDDDQADGFKSGRLRSENIPPDEVPADAR